MNPDSEIGVVKKMKEDTQCSQFYAILVIITSTFVVKGSYFMHKN